MRITSGKYKNKPLRSPNSGATHPMGERERLAIFNMLGSVENKTVLDLFAGTGALGIEALSRGAQKAVFVENNPKAIIALKHNIEDVDNAIILKTDAYNIGTDETYDIIFVDPPYDKFDRKALNFAKNLNINGVMVISSPEPINEDSRKYANCYVTLLTR